MPAIAEVRELSIAFPRPRGQWLRVVDGVSLTVEAGQTTAVVGESGSGKSLTALAMLGLVPAPGRVESGSLRVAGVDVRVASERELCRLRGHRVGFLLQEPGPALNPVRTLWSQVTETAHLAEPMSRTERLTMAARLLDEVGVQHSASLARAYPHELSGGQQQRGLLAAALAGSPRLLIADEPTAALDPVAQEEVLTLLQRLQGTRGLALLVISHDVRVVERLADQAVVMHAGETVEAGSRHVMLTAPRHPYARALLAACLTTRNDDGQFATIPGEAPVPGSRGPGCRFLARCPVAEPRCERARPRLAEVEPGHLVRCFLSGSGEDEGD